MKPIHTPTIATVLILLLAPAWAEKKGETDFLQSGMERYAAGDMDGAITAWTTHLKANRKDIAVYQKLGNAKQKKGDLEGAEGDYAYVIALDPNNAAAYNTLGIIKRAQGDFDGAVTHYTRALDLDPENASTYNNRGNAKRDRGDMDGAVADYARALEINPDYAGAYQNRGDAYFLTQRWSEALSDLSKRCELNLDGQEYARFFIWLIRARLGRTSEADAELAEYVAERWQGEPRDWPSRIGAFLLGKLSEVDFLAAAASPDPKTDRGQRCEAWFFLGMKRLLAGELEAAANDFRRCLATEQNSFVEYQSAQKELKTLGGN